MVIPNYSKAIVYDKAGQKIRQFDGGGNHYENFIDVVRSRKGSELRSNALEGHLSAALCHTANISYVLGKRQSPEAVRASVADNSEMAEMLGRMEEHLKANLVDLGKTPAVLGELLKMDGKAEKFVGNRAANRLLTRPYRKPFVVPAKV